MFEVESMMIRIGEGLRRSQAGDRVEARLIFARLWDEIGEDGDALHRCALAHSMADVQDDVADELVWDLRALEAAGQITDERLAMAGATGNVRGFYPSLHLNLGECYRKLGDLDRARAHLALGQAAAGALDDDMYGRAIKGGLGRLAAQVAPEPGNAPPSADDR